MLCVETDAQLLDDILAASFYIQKRLRGRLGRRLQILPVLMDKADPAQEKFFKASAEENMKVLSCLEGRIIGGYPSYDGANTNMTLRYVNVETNLPHATRSEVANLKFLMMAQKISDDDETMRKRYAASFNPDGIVRGPLSVLQQRCREGRGGAAVGRLRPGQGLLIPSSLLLPL